MGVFRLFLAFLVLVSHTWNLPREIPDIGGMAVATFFFVSGFLMPLTFECNYSNKDKSYASVATNFVYNRMLRIYPVYWFSLLVLIAHWHSGNSELLRNAVGEPSIFVQNFLLLGMNEYKLWGQYIIFNRPAWSLDTELRYYILLPVILLFWNARPRLAATGLIGTALYGLSIVNRPDIPDIALSLLAWSEFFFAGFVLYQLPRLKPYFLKRITGVTGGVVFVTSVLLLSKQWALVGGTIGLMLIASRLLVMQEKRMFSKFDGVAGDLAYPFYAFHIVVIVILSDHKFYETLLISKTDPLLLLSCNVAINFTLTLLVSYLALILIDRPVRKFRLNRRPLHD
jgi:peptidoglycan/LPS O-acetylase OafA/YrhL